MKQLFLMRHGNSDCVDHLSDHERPLNQQGRSEAHTIAEQIQQHRWTIDLAIVSDATRTTETWTVMNSILSQDTKPIAMRSEPRFYLTGLGALQEVLATQECNNILVLGHNPGWSAIVYRLSNRAIELNTANLVLLEHFSDSWKEAIHDPHWTMMSVLTPNSLS